MLLARERELVCRYARRLVADRLVVGTAGNLSVRLAEHVAVTPSGIDYDALTPEQISVVDLDGRHVDTAAEPSRELRIHLAVYGETNTAAVVHTHSPYATAVATVADELPAIHYLIADFGGPVRVAPYATPGSEQLARSVVAALASRSGALLANHGAITVGASLERAYGRSLTLEWLAALFTHARLLGEPRVLPHDEVARLVDLVRDYGRTPPA
jgi:L-fuculose-phosphate aldolase